MSTMMPCAERGAARRRMEEWRYGLWTIRNAIGWGWLTLAWMRRREYV